MAMSVLIAPISCFVFEVSCCFKSIVTTLSIALIANVCSYLTLINYVLVPRHNWVKRA